MNNTYFVSLKNVNLFIKNNRLKQKFQVTFNFNFSSIVALKYSFHISKNKNKFYEDLDLFIDGEWRKPISINSEKQYTTEVYNLLNENDEYKNISFKLINKDMIKDFLNTEFNNPGEKINWFKNLYEKNKA